MITRIEIDGFKSFVDFSLDLHPFTAVIGTNASGKSNLLDAFRFLSALTKGDVYDAVEAVRGDPASLFHQFSDGSRADRMRFAVETLVDPELAEDEFPLRSFQTRWRYDVLIVPAHGGFELVERLTEIADGAWFDFVGASPEWRSAYSREGAPSSLDMRRNPQTGRLIVDGDTYPLIADPLSHLASLRYCGFETAALRKISQREGRPEMHPDGSGLPGYLDSLRKATRTLDDSQGVLREIGMVLHGIIPDISDFEVIADRVRRDIRITFTARNEPPFEAEIASGGTLRTLALLAVLADRSQSAPIVVDEPENGLYPSRLRRLIEVMRDSASRPADDDPAAPLRQVLIAGHSPIVLDEKLVPGGQVVYLDVVDRIEKGKASRVTRARRAAETGARDSAAERGTLTPATVERLRSGDDWRY